MSDLTSTLLVVAILSFLGLIMWSKIMQQTMYDTIMEIRDIIKDLFSPNG